MARRRLIPGTPLLGFAELFSGAYGRDRSPRPRAKITPSCVGGVLLPYPCPYCSAVRSEPIDRRTRTDYADRERGFSWCPACRGRYVINFEGMPLPEPLPAGAVCAPAKVERAGEVEIIRQPPPEGPSGPQGGFDLLGAS